MAIRLSELAKLRPFTFHVTFPSNLSAIARLGEIRSASALLAGSADAVALSRPRRRDFEVIVEGFRVEVRDQLPLKPGHIRFEGGFSFTDVLAELNSRVFFWPGTEQGPIDYGQSHFQRYSSDGKALVLRCALKDLLAANEEKLLHVCRFNSGAPRHNPRSGRSPRGPETFVPLAKAPFSVGAVKELSFLDSALLPRSTEVSSNLYGPWRRLWSVA